MKHKINKGWVYCCIISENGVRLVWLF